MLEIEDKKEGNLHIVTKEAYRQCTHVQVRNNHPLHRHFAHQLLKCERTVNHAPELCKLFPLVQSTT